MKKPCGICGNEFDAARNARYCSEECRKEAINASSAAYRSRQVTRSTVKKLTRQQRAEKFTVRVKTLKGTVVLRGKERRAVKMVPVEGAPVIFMEYLTEGSIDTLCPAYIRHTFKQITAKEVSE